MKIKIIISVITLLFSLNNFSQKKSKLGIRLGLNNTNISHINSERSFSSYLGVLYPVKIGKNKTMQVELTYDNQKTKLINTTLISSGCMTYINDPISNCYIDEVKMSLITASLTYKFFNKEKFYAIAGTFLSAIMDENFNQYRPGMFNFSPLADFGLHVGAGFKLSPELILEFRYKKGFEDVILTREDRDSNQTDTMQLGIIYKFRKK